MRLSADFFKRIFSYYRPNTILIYRKRWYNRRGFGKILQSLLNRIFTTSIQKRHLMSARQDNQQFKYSSLYFLPVKRIKGFSFRISLQNLPGISFMTFSARYAWNLQPIFTAFILR